MLTIFILPFSITSITFSFDSIPSPQIAGDSIFISIQASDPEDFGGIGVLSALPTPSFREVPGSSIPESAVTRVAGYKLTEETETDRIDIKVILIFL